MSLRIVEAAAVWAPFSELSISEVYSLIIKEQIALQELQAKLESLRNDIQKAGERLTLARKIKEQQKCLSRLWRVARSFAPASASALFR